MWARKCLCIQSAGSFAQEIVLGQQAQMSYGVRIFPGNTIHHNEVGNREAEFLLCLPCEGGQGSHLEPETLRRTGHHLPQAPTG